jgi:poly(3-hydroxybutyrate) depolymerase
VVTFHGDADAAVPYECGQQAVEQWRLTNNLTLAAQGLPDRVAATPSNVREGVTEVPDGYPFTVRTWQSPASTCPVLQSWTIHGAGHYWYGGVSDPVLAQFTDPRGPNASQAAWDFFAGVERTERGYECRRG